MPLSIVGNLEVISKASMGAVVKSISTIDPSGVALLGVQQLMEENNSLRASLEEQKKLLEYLQKRLDEIESRFKEK